MKLRSDQLAAHLKEGLASAYLVTGDEPLLVMEDCDSIRAAARKKGIEERLVFHVEAGFDWKSLLEEANAMSLFASQRLIEVRLGNTKLSDKGETLRQLLSHPSPDNTLLIVCPRADSATQNSGWFKAAEKQGVVIQIWPIERQHYSGWLHKRLQQGGIQAEPGAVAALAHHTEGNLLAAVQEIEKLRISGLTRVSEEQLLAQMGDHSRFDAFAWADACMEGDLAAASRILNHLKAEGEEVIPLLGALVHKLHISLTLCGLKNQDLANAFKEARVWPRQQTAYKKLLSRLNEEKLLQAIRLASDIDDAAKGSGLDPWLLLAGLSGHLCGKAGNLAGR